MVGTDETRETSKGNSRSGAWPRETKGARARGEKN